jgi:hypothetical protein
MMNLLVILVLILVWNNTMAIFSSTPSREKGFKKRAGLASAASNSYGSKSYDPFHTHMQYYQGEVPQGIQYFAVRI